MKTIYNLTIIAIISIFLLNSCKKEKTFDNKSPQTSNLQYQIPYSKISVREKGFEGKNGSLQVLVFEDMQSVVETIDALYYQIDSWIQEFVEHYRDLTDEERNALAEEMGFNEQQPLIDFNEIYTFFSLYQLIAEQELEWLSSSEELDFSENPDNHFIFQYSTRAILNTDCEVQVGDTIYKLTEDGYFAIYDKSMSTLYNLNNNLSNYQLIPNIVFVGEENWKASGCNSNKRNSGEIKNQSNNNLKIEWVVSHWTHPWSRRCAAKVDNYKKSGSWKKYSTYCKVRSYGFISGIDQSGNAECDIQVNFNSGNNFKETTAKHEEHFIPVQTKTLSGWVKGYFYGAQGATTDKTLTW